MRRSGILMPISSLPSRYGIGSFGVEAYKFVDFLVEAGQSCWQILPLGPTSYGDSPYQSFSTFAGNPYFIDLDRLAAENLLLDVELVDADVGHTPDRIDYAALYQTRFVALRRAFGRFNTAALAYTEFCAAEAAWLDDFALFMSLKTAHGDRSWHAWDAPYRLRDRGALVAFMEEHRDDMEFWRFIQYEFFVQWRALKSYANERGISIFGDLPIYVADDSADVWANPELFDLDAEGLPVCVAGVPPDAFSADGQLWGNPVYNWEAMRADEFRWWVARMRMASSLCDIVRIDHFRGFESYYVLPYGAENAVNGSWRTGPGLELFSVLRDRLGDIAIVAENLGYLTPAVHRLHRETGYPGMNVLQFAFNPDDLLNENLPHYYAKNTVAYAGTHDNNTSLGWFSSLAKRDSDYVLEYMANASGSDFLPHFLSLLLGSPADLAIMTMPDCLGFGAEARMNTPSTIGNNWQWRMLPGAYTPSLAQQLARWSALYGRTRSIAG